LVSITQRQQVAQIQGRPVYAVTNVAIIPISSQADANRAIAQARKEVSQGDPDLNSDSEDDIPDHVTDHAETEIGSAPTSPGRQATFHTRGASVGSIAEDVIGKRVPFGRFAANWLSRRNLGLPRPGAIGQDVPESPFDETSSPGTATPDAESKEDEAVEAALPEDQKDDVKLGERDDRPQSDQAAELLPKLLKYTKLLFASHNFFFAYNYDLTRPFNAQGARTEQLPLHKAVDPLVGTICAKCLISFANTALVLLE
jgi:hypothetical protein